MGDIDTIDRIIIPKVGISMEIIIKGRVTEVEDRTGTTTKDSMEVMMVSSREDTEGLTITMGCSSKEVDTLVADTKTTTTRTRENRRDLIVSSRGSTNSLSDCRDLPKMILEVGLGLLRGRRVGVEIGSRKVELNESLLRGYCWQNNMTLLLQ